MTYELTSRQVIEYLQRLDRERMIRWYHRLLRIIS